MFVKRFIYLPPPEAKFLVVASVSVQFMNLERQTVIRRYLHTFHTCQLVSYRASYASTVLAVIVSVCLSKVGVVQRWLNLGSHQQRYTATNRP